MVSEDSNPIGAVFPPFHRRRKQFITLMHDMRFRGS